MKLEVGKYYKTRKGIKIGPAVYDNTSSHFPFNVPWSKGSYYYRPDGTSCLDWEEDDIVAEWLD